MMLVICAKLTCKTVTRIYANSAGELTGLVGEASGWWPDKYHCPNCEGTATAVYEGQIDPKEFDGFNVRELEAQDFFRFMMGVGLPEESDCTLEVLTDVFKAGKVGKLAGHRIAGTKRFCVEWLEMEDGTRLYFGASAHGATIFRIVRKTNFAEKVTGDGTG